MPTTIITGRDLVVTIATVNYDAQATSATLANSPTVETYQTLDGKAYKHIDDQWTLNMELLADWGVASSLFEAMWTAFTTAPNTALAFSLTTATGAVFTGNVFPVAPTAGGAAPDAVRLDRCLCAAGDPVLSVCRRADCPARRFREWKIHPAQPIGGPRFADAWHAALSKHGPHGIGRGGTDAVSPPRGRLRFPGLQPHPQPYGAGECRAHHGDLSGADGPRGSPGAGGLGGPDGSLSCPAFRRRTAAGGYCPGDREAPGCAPLRRADGRPGCSDRHHGPRSDRTE